MKIFSSTRLLIVVFSFLTLTQISNSVNTKEVSAKESSLRIGLCAQMVVENEEEKCGSANVTSRLKTIEDLAWVLTPRSYLLSNGNEYIFRSIHEALFEVCSMSNTFLQTMNTGIDFDLRNLILFAEPDWQKRASIESPYMHLICSPMVNPQLWASLYQYLLQLPSRDFPTITQALERFALSHPLLLGSIREFGKFKCAPNPACKLPQSDDRFCSPGVRTQVFDEWELTMTWTDHLSGSTATGTGFLVQGCLNKKQTWAVFSLISPQSGSNFEAFKNILLEGGFQDGYFTSGKYNTIY